MMVLKRVFSSYSATLGLLILLAAFVVLGARVADAFMLEMAFVVGAIIMYGRAEVQAEKRSWLKIFSLTAGLGLVGLALFNYVVNPFNFYPTHFFQPLSISTRNAKMDVYEAQPTPPEAVILSNSRSFMVETEQIKKLWHYDAVNMSVGSGTLQDDMAFVRFMLDKGKMPKLLIMSLSPERFVTQDFRTAEPDSRLWNYLDDQMRISDLQLDLDRWSFLFKQEQTAASIRLIQAEIQGGRPPLTGQFDETGVILNYTRQPLPEDFDPAALEKNSWTGWFNEAFNPHMEDEGMQQFERILELAKAHGTLVIGYAPPVHPLFKAFLDTHTDFERVRQRIDGELQALTEQYDFHFTDFMDDPAFTDGDTMFHDTMHPQSSITEAMMQTLYDQYGKYRAP